MPLSFRRASLAGLGVMLALAAPAATLAFAQESKPAAEAPAKPVDPAAVVATINGQPVTEGDLTIAEGDLDQQFSRLPADQRRAAALSAVIEIRLLANEAEAKGLDKDPEFQRRMQFLKDRALHSQVVEQEVSKAITDDEVRARYDKEIADAPPVNEVHARHILVKTKEEAEAIIKQLDKGAKFEDIAKEKSSDAGSGANGGDLGYFGPGQMVPEFEKAAFALKPGTYTKEPVQTQFGWHIIKVEDKRVQQPPAFDQVKDQVRSLLLRDKYFALVKSLRGAAKIDVTDPDLKKAVDQIDQAK